MEQVNKCRQTITSLSNENIKKCSNYRWYILAILFAVYTVNFADRANIGVVLPVLREEFQLTNAGAGSLASMFFFGYAIIQLPAGFLLSKKGARGIVTTAIVGFSAFTFLIGTAASANLIRWYRFSLGLFEGPSPIGSSTILKNWYPKHEQATATGIYMSASVLGQVIVPPLAVWILLNYDWRTVFYICALPGFILAIIWWIFIRTNPEQSSFCNEAELAYIKNDIADSKQFADQQTWFSKIVDKIIVPRDIPLLTTCSR